MPNTEIDDQRDRITITFDLDEGQQFRVGRLILNGVEPYAGAGQQLIDAWKPHEGQGPLGRGTDELAKLAGRTVSPYGRG
ncbi:MAG: hypothetical protein ACXVZX_14445 [Terriglobales bacterium]